MKEAGIRAQEPVLRTRRDIDPCPIPPSTLDYWVLACPRCGTELEITGDLAPCAGCASTYARVDGIWSFLDEDRGQRYSRFLERYRMVRANEGWGRPEAAYFRDLPRVAPDDTQRKIWRVRERSFRLVITRVVAPMETRPGGGLRIVDAGAGNCWLSNRLARLGHHTVAIDVSLDDVDGLGAHVWYDPPEEVAFVSIQAEMDSLPLASSQANLVIFNASLHYTADASITLGEALRVLRPGGKLVVMDTPLYRNAESGTAMICEREEAFEQDYGFSQEPGFRSEGFLTYRRLDELAAELSLHWKVIPLTSVPRRTARAVRTRLSRARETAEMPLLVGERV